MQIAEVERHLGTIEDQIRAMFSAAEAEGRMAFNEKEFEEHGKLEAQRRAVKDTLKRLKEHEDEERTLSRPTTEAERPEVTTNGHDERAVTPEEKRWYTPLASSAPKILHDYNLQRSFGQFLHAVAFAERFPNRRDARLDYYEERAASGANEYIPSEGGFLVQPEMSQELLMRVIDTGVLASRADRMSVGPNSNGFRFNAVDETSRATGSRWGGVQVYWTGEAEQKTATKPKLRQIEVTLQKLTGLFYATDEMLADSTVMGQLADRAFRNEFGFEIDNSILHGTGVGMPLGILNSPALITVTKESGQTAATIQWENVAKMYARLTPSSRARAVWLVNQDVLFELSTMAFAVGTGGVPVFMPAGGISGSPFETLYGRPMIPIEQAETLGTKGDILLVDLDQYLLVEKGGIDTASSIHVRFIYDETAFRWVARLNGQPKWTSALTPYKGTATTSPFVALETRS